MLLRNKKGGGTGGHPNSTRQLNTYHYLDTIKFI